MVIIKQISQFSCVAACIQSFFADHFITTSQSSLIYNFPDLFFVDDDKYPKRLGAIDFENIGELGLRLLNKIGKGFECEEFAGRLSAPLNPDETIFLTTRKKLEKPEEDFCHCVRFKEVVGNQVVVMNPSKGIGEEEFYFDSWTIEQMEIMKCVAYKLKLNRRET